ncbi:MAG TPA: hypothetical protein VGQ62_07900 [Chloroflexota bacterium]|nr:hypothetical protein [Chloroflexota bacterium]
MDEPRTPSSIEAVVNANLGSAPGRGQGLPDEDVSLNQVLGATAEGTPAAEKPSSRTGTAADNSARG